MTAFAVTSTDPRVNVFALAAVMETKGGCGDCITLNSGWCALNPSPHFLLQGWHMERQTNSLHFSVLPSHTVERAKEMVRDLKECVEIVKVCSETMVVCSNWNCGDELIVFALQADPSLVKKGTAAMYGLIGTIPDKTILDDYLRQLLNTLY